MSTSLWHELDASEVRRQITEAQGTVCAVPSCQQPWTDAAHIRASGMGGRLSTYTVENLVGLCRHHHDQFDGRRMQGRQDLLRELMEYTIGRIRQDRRMLKERSQHG